MLAAALSTFSLVLLAGSDEGGIPAWVPKTLNLAVFLGILYFLLRKPLASFLEARTAAIRADLERAKRDKEIAESKLAEVEARLARLAEEQAQIRAEAATEAETEHARIRARAEEEARKIAETTEREIAGALQAARADLQRFVAEQSVQLAEGIIRSEMNDADRQRIVGQYADQLQEVRK